MDATTDNMSARVRNSGLLYPMMLIAALSVIVFSVVGIATMMGWLPKALSGDDPVEKLAGPPAYSSPRPATGNATHTASVPRANSNAARVARTSAACPDCGVIESIRALEVKGNTGWMGAAGGAVIGGLLGNQFGSGRGRTAATVVGAGAGAYAGNEIEKNMHQRVSYQVRIRMEDGSYRTFTESSQPAYGIGQKVRVTDKGIRAAG